MVAAEMTSPQVRIRRRWIETLPTIPSGSLELPVPDFEPGAAKTLPSPRHVVRRVDGSNVLLVGQMDFVASTQAWAMPFDALHLDGEGQFARFELG